jgi:hypothetical protein
MSRNAAPRRGRHFFCLPVEKPSVTSTTHPMKATIANNTLTIEIPLEKPRPSASGKTLVVATTGGNITTTAQVNGKPVTIGLNAYIKP